MLNQEVAVHLVPAQQRTKKLLDVHEWNRLSIALFYEGKLLRLGVSRVSDGSSLKQWTFCIDRRHHERIEIEDAIIEVEYRPAQISLTVHRRTIRRGFLSRFFGAMNPQKLHWADYALRPDGFVAVHRPGESRIVG